MNMVGPLIEVKLLMSWQYKIQNNFLAHHIFGNINFNSGLSTKIYLWESIGSLNMDGECWAHNKCNKWNEPKSRVLNRLTYREYSEHLNNFTRVEAESSVRRRKGILANKEILGRLSGKVFFQDSHVHKILEFVLAHEFVCFRPQDLVENAIKCKLTGV